MRKLNRIFLTLVCLCLLICTAADTTPKAYAGSSMTASESCIEFIKKIEGFSAKPYHDYSQYTVGYGTKCPDDKFNAYTADGISKKEAEALLQKELVDISDAINQRLVDRYSLTLTQHQFDALVSFSFNIGTGWMTYDSTLRNAILRNADENDLVYAFSLYCTADGKYLPGLVTRRLCEANMFLNGIYSTSRSNDYGYVYYDANGGTVTYRVQGFICDNMSVPAGNAVRSSDVFLGWYTDLTGGTQVDTLNSSLIGKTLFARWQSSENSENQNSSSTTVKVTGDIVNIRTGPGTNYNLAKQVRRNTVLTVTHVSHLTNMRWGKVQEGWICLDYTNYDAVIAGTNHKDVENNTSASDNNAISNPDTDISQESQNHLSGIVNVKDFLRVRSGPGTTFSTVGFLFDGNKVKILEQKTAGSMVWGRISDGWVSMDYITTDALSGDEANDSDTNQKPDQEITDSVSKVESVSIKGKITADALRIRSKPGTTNPIVGLYQQNDTVIISEKSLVGVVYWGKTNRGWISMDYVLTDSSGGESPKPVTDGTKTVTADCLRIRKDAGTNHKIVGFLYHGDTVTVLETKNVDGMIWGKINNGWICMKYTK